MTSISTIIVAVTCIAFVYGQTTIGPCLGGACPSGYTCISGLCTSNTPPASQCRDIAVNCPSLAYLCNNNAYYTLMTQQCPRTCGRCTGATTTAPCVDRVNPSTGISDCPQTAYLCNNSAYYTLMTQQCPRTCGRCPSG